MSRARYPADTVQLRIERGVRRDRFPDLHREEVQANGRNQSLRHLAAMNNWYRLEHRGLAGAALAGLLPGTPMSSAGGEAVEAVQGTGRSAKVLSLNEDLF